MKNKIIITIVPPSHVVNKKGTTINTFPFQDVHKIIVFDHGKVIEQGTHNELINITNGKYQSIIQPQGQPQ
eukprot:UN07863